jgi:hypothetical protein
VRGTHFLSSTDAETIQDTKRKLESEGHSLPVEPRQRGKSDAKAREQGTLTSCEIEIGECVRTPKESKRGETH